MFKIKVKMQMPDGDIKKFEIENVMKYEVDELGIMVSTGIMRNPKIWGYPPLPNTIQLQGDIISIKKVIKTAENQKIDISKLKPCNKYLGNTFEQQTIKLVEEVSEVIEANARKNKEHALEEVVDVIQAGLTYLQIYKDRGYNVNDAIDRVIIKNNKKDRKYYDEGGKDNEK